MIYTLPKHFNHNSIDDFLLKFGDIFFRVEKNEPDVIVQCSNYHKISLIGVVLLYKWMDFAFKEDCFDSPEILFSQKNNIFSSLERYGFEDLMDGLVKNITPKREKQIYASLRVRQENNFIIAPQPMIRGDSLTRDNLHKKYAPQIVNFYNDDSVTTMVLTCISEILLNFWKHALDDPQSILIAEGNKSKIEIGCADTGNGIITTLREGKPDFIELTPKQILQKSIQKNVTSKPNTPHMGRGLWILDEIATVTGGIFHLYSEGVSYKNQNGKKVIDSCGYWRGTIV
jgi:hypothetical protein